MNRELNRACPNQKELYAFAVGDLDDGRLEQLAVHLVDCAMCGTVVDEFSMHPHSGLIADLRTINIPSADLVKRLNSPGFQVPETLLQAVFDATDPASIPVSFDPGRRLANRLANGPVRLGRFELQSVLGVGAFGYVFKAATTPGEKTSPTKMVLNCEQFRLWGSVAEHWMTPIVHQTRVFPQRQMSMVGPTTSLR